MKTDKKIEEKIKELLDMLFIEETKYKVNVAQSSTVSNTVPDIRSSPEYSAVNIVGKEAITKLLYTLIQEERKDAIRWFADWLYEHNYCDDDIYLEGGIEQYLQSLDKGDTDENR